MYSPIPVPTMLSRKAVQRPEKSPSHQPIQLPQLALNSVVKRRITHTPGINRSVNSQILRVGQTNTILVSIVNLKLPVSNPKWLKFRLRFLLRDIILLNMWRIARLGLLPRQILLSLAFLTAVVSGCGDDDPPQQGGDIVLTDVLVPLAVGNVWSGTYTRFDSTGADSSSHVLTYEIIDDTTIGRFRWYVEELTIDDTLSTRSLYKNLHAGLFRLETEVFSDSALLSYKYPASRNDQYTRIDRGYVAIPTADTAIVVPRGTFSCIHYETILFQALDNDSNIVGGGMLNEFLSPGAGYVKWEQFIFDDNDSAIMVGRFELDSLVLISRSPSVGFPTGPQVR